MVDEKICQAWREAGLRLGIRVIAPFELELSDGSTLPVEAFLPDFGGRDGTAAISLEDEVRYKRASASRSFVSLLSSSYRHFDDGLFRETLQDWGWFGAQSAAPKWFTDGRQG